MTKCLHETFSRRPDHKDLDRQIIVTGCTRLDAFRQAGDSLAGRFFIHYLLPFPPSELKNSEFNDDLDRFLRRGWGLDFFQELWPCPYL